MEIRRCPFRVSRRWDSRCRDSAVSRGAEADARPRNFPKKPGQRFCRRGESTASRNTGNRKRETGKLKPSSSRGLISVFVVCYFGVHHTGRPQMAQAGAEEEKGHGI